MDLEEYVKELKQDLKEVKQDVKTLMEWYAVEKANNKRKTVYVSGIVSVAVGIIGSIVRHFIEKG